MSNQLFAAPLPMQTGVTTGTGRAVALNHARRSAVYIKWGAGVGAGAFIVETADSPDYAGTWTPVATKTFAAASSEDEVRIDYPVGAVRTRATTNVTGGTVDTLVQAWN